MGSSLWRFCVNRKVRDQLPSLSAVRLGQRSLIDWRLALLAACVATSFNLLPVDLPRAAANPFVRFDYNLTLNTRSRNTVFIELFDDRPITRDNFLLYVNGGKYDGTLMHRLSWDFVLQGGGYYPVIQFEPALANQQSLDPNAEVDLDGNPANANPFIQNEYANSPPRSNLRGTLAMAKQGGNPNSASNEFFFNISNNSANLDNQNGGFTVFAQVVGDGMAMIDAFNGLNITNLNPDYDDNGTRDGGPFYTGSGDGVPYLGNNLIVLQDANRIDYLGTGLTTTVPTSGLTFSARDAYIDTGTIFNNQSTTTGPLTIGANRLLGVREGFALNRTLINHGTLAPGLQLGAITVQGDYQQFSDGKLQTQLRGTTADTEYDKLIVTNVAGLAGKLEVSLLGGYTPAAGSSFTVLSAAALAGNFSSVDLPILSNGLVWSYSRTLTAVNLTVASADFNRNGVVDLADYILWRQTKGLTGVTDRAGADGNGDGTVNDLDLAIWRSNFGNTSGGTLFTGAGAGAGLSGATVPEPATLLLVLTVGLIAATRRCNSRARQLQITG